MDLKVGNLPVPAIHVGSTPVKSVYVGSKLVWSATVQITLGTGLEARDQFRAALAERGLDHTTVKEVPFEIELVGTGSVQHMFESCWALTTVPEMDTSGVTDMRSMFAYCSALTTVPAMDTSNVTSMNRMFHSCYALTSVPDMNTSQVTDMSFTFYYCQSLTDGNASLTGRNPNVYTSNMIVGSSLTREPWYTAGGAPIDVYEVSFYGEYGRGKLIPLVNVTIPAGEEWAVRVQGSFTRTTNWSASKPEIRIGTAISIKYSQGEAVDFSGTVNSSDSTIAAVMNRSNSGDLTDFVGTVTIEQVVQITPGFGHDARNQFHAALTNRGLDYQTVKRIPFGIEVVGSGSMAQMFFGCASLTSVPAMDTSQVTDMYGMFYGCSSLAYVPDMDTGQVTDMASMFRNCSSLTDGNVRLIGRNPNVYTASMITGSGMTRFPFYDTFGNPI